MSHAEEYQGPWLRSAGWDGFWMLSGLWLLPLLAVSAVVPGALKSGLIVASLLLWLSHRFATTYSAFCTPAYRNLVSEQRRRFLWLPGVIILLTFGFVYAPRTLVPIDSWGKIQVLGTLFFLYNAYHFGIQHYGVLSIYRIRTGQSPSGWLKRYEKFFCLVVGSLAVAIAQICHGAEVVGDSIVYPVVPRDVFMSAFALLQVVMPVIIVILAAVFFVGEFRMGQVSLPKVVYAAGLMLQGISAYFLDPIAFLILWGVQHWLVSVALGGHMAQNDTSEIPASSRWYGFWSRFKGFWPTVFVLCLASIILSPLFAYAVHPEKIAEGPDFFSFLSPVLAIPAISNLFIALNFSSVFIHFVMDRAIFRFSHPAVRKVSVPLLFELRA